MIFVLICEAVSRPKAPGPPQNQQPAGPEARFRPGPPREGFPDDGPPPDRPPPPDGPERRPLPPPFQSPRAMFVEGLVMRAKSNIPIYWVVVSIAQAVRLLRRSQERERQAFELEARLAEAKLTALRMQLHPHFLFNTLNAISTLVHTDARAADEMITNLSELLRATLSTSDQPEVSLRHELEILDRYLAIQQVRFGDRLHIEKEIQNDSLEARVPALILQPLVENAIRHGIEPQRRPGRIGVRARRDRDILRLAVQDNGGGAGPGMKEGIGLANTRSRLQELYGSQGKMSMSPGAEGGFVVELEIPYHEDSSDHR
jgi:LytS/YehU family sensor histidine kinase